MKCDDMALYSGSECNIFESDSGDRYVSYDSPDGRCLVFESEDDIVPPFVAEILRLATENAELRKGDMFECACCETEWFVDDISAFCEHCIYKSNNAASDAISRARAEGRLEGMKSLYMDIEDVDSAGDARAVVRIRIAAAERELAGVRKE